MDIKDLNKSQMVLLLILLSFVVSIATSVTTYSLLEKAPENVKNPITQVVQRTVEKIVEVEKGQTLSNDELKLIEDLKALKPLIDKLASEESENNNTTVVDTKDINVVKDDTTKNKEIPPKDTTVPTETSKP